jgi:hypothetical protein
LLYYSPLGASAATVSEHVGSFARHSRFPVFSVNTELGFPRGLLRLGFRVVVLHYSVFGRYPYLLSDAFCRYLADSSDSYRIAFFQDEYQYCTARFRFLDDMRIDCVYSLLEPAEVSRVYLKHTRVPKVLHTLTGFVSDDLIEAAQRWALPDEQRQIDVGYRGRQLPFFMGRGAQEKTVIAQEFVKRTAGMPLVLDIKSGEADRIYGDDWWRFIANCRGMLGVEAGVSVFDIEDKVRPRCAQILRERPGASFEEVSTLALREWEDNIYYRTISPRVFEAAAFRVCQILFEGRYNGLLEPMIHYLPLKKDFSNLDWVLSAFADPGTRQRIAERAYADLIGSGVYSFRRFIEQFDADLRQAGIEPAADPAALQQATELLDQGRRLRALRARIQTRLHRPFPGKALVKAALSPLLKRRTQAAD